MVSSELCMTGILSFDTVVFLKLSALLCCFCVLDSQVLPQEYPLQAARPKHVEDQPLLTTVAARALTTMTSPNQSPPHPRQHHQATMRKVSHLFKGHMEALSQSIYPVPLGEFN